MNFFFDFFFNLWLSFVCRRLRQSVVFGKFSSLAISRLLQSFIFRNALSWSSFDFNSFFHFLSNFTKCCFALTGWGNARSKKENGTALMLSTLKLQLFYLVTSIYVWLFLYYITNVIIFISGTSRKIRQRDSYTTKPRSKSSTRSLTPCAFICSQYPTQSRRSLLQRLLQLITGQVTFKVFMATKKMIDVNNKASLPFFLGRENNGA